jgi:hypothetical protein
MIDELKPCDLYYTEMIASLERENEQIRLALKDLVAYIDRGNWADHNLDNILRAGRAAITKAEGK